MSGQNIGGYSACEPSVDICEIPPRYPEGVMKVAVGPPGGCRSLASGHPPGQFPRLLDAERQRLALAVIGRIVVDVILVGQSRIVLVEPVSDEIRPHLRDVLDACLSVGSDVDRAAVLPRLRAGFPIRLEYVEFDRIA